MTIGYIQLFAHGIACAGKTMITKVGDHYQVFHLDKFGTKHVLDASYRSYEDATCIIQAHQEGWWE